MKRPFKRQQKKKRHGPTFWDHEYSHASHLALSTNHSGDLEKFTRWISRRDRNDILASDASVLDVGCGNGRNLIFLSQTFGVSGHGFDISKTAVSQARTAARSLPLTFSTQSAADTLPVEVGSQSLVLDMMTSHFLNKKERESLRNEIYRVLKPGGFLFMKTFLGDGDLHTKRLLETEPAKEPGSYIHPVIGVPEYVYFEDVLIPFLEEKFIVHKVYRSHKHVSKGKARKRRTISVYVEKDYH